MPGFCPLEVIICDHGSQFDSKLFTDLLEKYHVRKVSAPLYYAQANPVEATNKTIKQMLRAEILARASQHEEWAVLLPYVTMNINTTFHTSTGFSPHYLVFGQEKARDGREHSAIVDANPDQTTCTERRECIYDEAAEAQRAAFEAGKERYNLRANVRKFQVGDEVYLKNRQLSNKGEKYTKKLAQFKFRARIAKVVGTDTYLLTDPTSNKQYGVYNSRDIFMK